VNSLLKKLPFRDIYKIEGVSQFLIMNKTLQILCVILIGPHLNASTLEIGLVGKYTFEDGSANDSSGNNNNGISYNTTLTTGIQGNGFRFNGVDSIIKISALIPQYTTAGTIFTWYRANPNPDLSIQNPYGGIAAAYQHIITQNRKPAQYAPGLFLTLWNKPYLETPSSGINLSDSQIRAGYSDEYPGNNTWHNEYLEGNENSLGLDGQWHSIASTLFSDISGKTLKIFFDGNLLGSLNISNPDQEALTDAELFIGGGFNNSIPDAFFNGDIDNVHVYERTLSDLEVASLHIATAPEPSALSLLAVGLGVVLRRRRRTV